MFEALDEIAIADPTAKTKAAVETFARGEQRYWNPNLKPVPGYAPRVGQRGFSQPTWYDDNAWVGVAFLDAYRATGNHTYVTDAERAFAFIASGGWDAKQGGGKEPAQAAGRLSPGGEHTISLPDRAGLICQSGSNGRAGDSDVCGRQR